MVNPWRWLSDFLAIGMAELGSIASQRIYRLIAGSRELLFPWPGTPD
jgi:histidine ammonia-lyase